MMKNTIGNNIKKLRKESGITQEQLLQSFVLVVKRYPIMKQGKGFLIFMS